MSIQAEKFIKRIAPLSKTFTLKGVVNMMESYKVQAIESDRSEIIQFLEKCIENCNGYINMPGYPDHDPYGSKAMRAAYEVVLNQIKK